MLYAFALLLMLTIRPWICSRCLPMQSKMSVYAAMYFIPILAMAHAIGAGIICKLKINLTLQTFY